MKTINIDKDLDLIDEHTPFCRHGAGDIIVDFSEVKNHIIAQGEKIYKLEQLLKNK